MTIGDELQGNSPNTIGTIDPLEAFTGGGLDKMEQVDVSAGQQVNQSQPTQHNNQNQPAQQQQGDNGSSVLENVVSDLGEFAADPDVQAGLSRIGQALGGKRSFGQQLGQAAERGAKSRAYQQRVQAIMEGTAPESGGALSPQEQQAAMQEGLRRRMQPTREEQAEAEVEQTKAGTEAQRAETEAARTQTEISEAKLKYLDEQMRTSIEETRQNIATAESREDLYDAKSKLQKMQQFRETMTSSKASAQDKADFAERMYFELSDQITPEKVEEKRKELGITEDLQKRAQQSEEAKNKLQKRKADLRMWMLTRDVMSEENAKALKGIKNFLTDYYNLQGLSEEAPGGAAAGDTSGVEQRFMKKQTEE